jgi:hypothetical protein
MLAQASDPAPHSPALSGIFHNPVTIFGVAVSLCIILGVVYINGLHRIFNTQYLTGVGGWQTGTGAGAGSCCDAAQVGGRPVMLIWRMLPIPEHNHWSSLLLLIKVMLERPQTSLLLISSQQQTPKYSLLNVCPGGPPHDVVGWLPQLGFLLIMLPFTEWTKYRTRRHPTRWVASHLQW